MTMNRNIKLLIVEDSKLMQQVLSNIFSIDPCITIVGVAGDPLSARDLIKKTNPDVITLDIMMPHMDGITFLKNLMRLHPLPVVMVSALTEKNSAIALEALSFGAVDYISKPSQNEFTSESDYAKHLIMAVKNASKAHVHHITPLNLQENLSLGISEKILTQTNLLNKEIIVIGASMGGVEAIEHILVQMPKIMPPIVVVQHIRKEFSSAFAQRIDKICTLSISEAKDNDVLLPSHVYIAPGGCNLVIKKRQSNFITLLQSNLHDNLHMPSVDVLFQSAAKAAGSCTIGILLTGMGKDGVEGLRAIKNAGGITIAQDETTSVIWGMPGAAVKENLVDYVLPLQKIPQKVLSLLEDKSEKKI
jgi:two-component system, chemotaxis family, protein-glutamate methylesterase/glutaminase